MMLPQTTSQLTFPRWLRLVGLSLLTCVAGLALALAAAGCSGQKKANVALQPIDNGRALALIERVITSSGRKAQPGRSFKLQELDFREAFYIDGVYGIAFLTEQDAVKYEKVLPPRNLQPGQLRLFRPAENAIVLLLYQDKYRYDSGEAHTVTVTTAEVELEKDVADYVEQVVKQDKHP